MGDSPSADSPSADSPSAGVARASAVMAAGTLASRILGFIRASLLVALLGAAASDLAGNSFALANGLPGTIYLLLAGGALNAVLVPQITRADAQGEAGRAVVDRLVTIAVTGLVVVTIALTLAAMPLIALYADSDWPAEQRALAVAFAFWSIPQVFFYGMYAVFGQILNARKSFGPYTWAPVVNNVVAIIALATLLLTVGSLRERDPADFGWPLVAAIAGSATLGVSLQALVLLLPLRAVGFRFRPRWRWRGTGLRSAGLVAGWTFAALLCTQIAFLVLSRISTGAGAAAVQTGVGDSSGANAAWSNAFLLFILPHSLLAVSVVTARFTGLAQSAGAGDLDAVRRDTLSSARTLLIAMSLPAAGFVVLAQPVAVLLFGHGAEQGIAIGAVLAGMAVGLPAFSLTYLLQRTFYAMTDGRTPFVVQAITSGSWIASMIVIAALAPPSLVVPLVALTMSLTTLLGCFLLLGWAARRLPGFELRRLLSAWLRASLTGAVAAGITLAVLWRVDAVEGWWLPTVGTRTDALVTLLVGGGVGLLAFGVAGRLLRLYRVRPLLGMAGSFTRRLRRR